MISKKKCLKQICFFTLTVIFLHLFVFSTHSFAQTVTYKITALKKTNQSLIYTSQLNYDDSLYLFLQGDKSYILEGVIFVTCASNTPDIKIGFDVPDGANLTLGYESIGGSGSIIMDNVATSQINIENIRPKTAISIKGTITMPASNGLVQFKWAPNVSAAPETIVNKGSFIAARLIE